MDQCVVNGYLGLKWSMTLVKFSMILCSLEHWVRGYTARVLTLCMEYLQSINDRPHSVELVDRVLVTLRSPGSSALRR